jgi:hypothetical protein
MRICELCGGSLGIIVLVRVDRARVRAIVLNVSRTKGVGYATRLSEAVAG